MSSDSDFHVDDPEAPGPAAAPDEWAALDRELEAMVAAEPEVVADDEPVTPAYSRFDTVLFDGDTGELTMEARTALAAIIKRNYLWRESHPSTWDALVLHRRVIESRLNELFLQLRIDQEIGIAYKIEAAAPGSTPFPKMLNARNVAYSWTTTMLLRHLREAYANDVGRDGSSHVVVSRTEMIDRLRSDRSSRSNDETLERKVAEKAFEEVEREGIVLRTPDEDRYRISPVISSLMTLEKLQQLAAYLDTLDGTEGEDFDEDTDGGNGSL